MKEARYCRVTFYLVKIYNELSEIVSFTFLIF